MKDSNSQLVAVLFCSVDTVLPYEVDSIVAGAAAAVAVVASQNHSAGSCHALAGLDGDIGLWSLAVSWQALNQITHH
jgi:hypothetical protein